TLVQVAQRTGADIVVCACDVFSHHDRPASGEEARNRWIPLGPALGAGLFRNCFGDTNALVRRDAYERIGGYREDWGFTLEDWDFHARAAFAGLHVEVVPEPLYWYRSIEGTQVVSGNHAANLSRVLATYIANTDPSGHDALRRAHEVVAMRDQGAPTKA